MPKIDSTCIMRIVVFLDNKIDHFDDTMMLNV